MRPTGQSRKLCGERSLCGHRVRLTGQLRVTAFLARLSRFIGLGIYCTLGYCGGHGKAFEALTGSSERTLQRVHYALRQCPAGFPAAALSWSFRREWNTEKNKSTKYQPRRGDLVSQRGYFVGTTKMFVRINRSEQ